MNGRSFNIYILGLSVCAFAAGKVVKAPGRGLALAVSDISLPKLRMPSGPLTGIAREPLPPAPGTCPSGYLPQYCQWIPGVSVSGLSACGPTDPIWLCIQKGREAASLQAGCLNGQPGCLFQAPMMPQQMPAQQAQQQQGSPMMNPAMNPMMNPASYNSSRGGGRSEPVARGSSGIRGSGQLEECSKPLPPQVDSALKEAIAFRASCPIANRGDKPIVINDYSWTQGTARPPQMWVFKNGGECVGKTAVTYGNGASPEGPLPCAEGSKHLTPPGFHLTAQHTGSSYGPNDSLTLIGLQGQQSLTRDILIHYSESPGMKVSWGCSGIECLGPVMKMLGYGSLVYNYFGSTKTPAGCRIQNGMHDRKTCQMDKPSDQKYQAEIDSLPPQQMAPSNRGLAGKPANTGQTEPQAPESPPATK